MLRQYLNVASSGEVRTIPRSFSLRSDAIPYFLGLSLLRADRIILISPWISDINVEFPLTDRLEVDSMTLIDALHEFPETEYTLLTSEDSYNDYIIERIEDIATVQKIENLHAKAIVTDDLVYVGSANITRSGVGTNVELAHVIENEYANASKFVHAELPVDI
jgi:hypothetical protein